MDVDVVVAAAARLGEGPRWWAGQLLWIDVLAGLLHRFDPEAGTDAVVDLGDVVGMVAPRRAGGLVAGLGRSVVRLDDAMREVARTDVEADRPANRLNDGRCDAAGRLWVGTMRRDGTGAQGALYRVDPDGTVHQRLDAVGLSNGLDWSPDGRRLYYIDTPTQRVDVFDYDGDLGEARDRRPFVTVPEEHGAPDGLVVDADGCVWVACYGGWSVRRYTPDGVLDREIGLPVANVTACAFGGADLRDLYITTATDGLNAAARVAQPLAGALFRASPGVAGLPTSPFGG